MTKKSYYDQVYEITNMIPQGKVCTYGIIADFLTLGSARMVGYALTKLHKGSSVPAHRVVNRLGELSGRVHFPTPTYMQEMLEKEGVMVKNHKIQNFDEVLWKPDDLLGDDY